MSCTILVFVKQVPDTKNITGDAMKPDGTVNRAALPAIFNPDDLNALELALQLKDRYGAKVIAATMGPPNAANILRDALFRGADETILLSDRAFAGSDTLATSFALSRVAKKVADADIIICGRQAIDGDTAQVGPQIAEKLDIPQISYVQEVLDLQDGKIRAKRAIEGGYEVLESPTPVLLTVIDANDPRPENAFHILKYKKAKTASEIAKNKGEAATPDELAEMQKKGLLIQEWTAKDAVPEAEFSRLGFSGSPTSVKEIVSVVLKGGDFKEIAPTAEGINTFVHELIEDHTLG